MTIAELADRQAITDRIHRYCRAVDRLDTALGHGVFHPDGRAAFGSYAGSGRGWIDFICARHRAMIGHSHQVTNILIDLAGDRAGSESYVTATLRLRADAGIVDHVYLARYVDSWSRREGGWAIDARECLVDLATETTVTPIATNGRARRDGSDPSFAVLGPAT